MIDKIKKFRPSIKVSWFGAIVFSILSLITVTTQYWKYIPVVNIILYVGAMVFISMAVWSLIIRSKDIYKKIYDLGHGFSYIARMWDDYRYRTIVSGYMSLFVNIILVISKGIAGCYFASMWMIVLSMYYLLLCITKFFLLRNHRKLEKSRNKNVRLKKEWEIVRICGIFFILLVLILQVLVLMIVKDGNSFSYQGVLIYAVAAYDFYCLSCSIIYMIKMRKRHSPSIVAIKCISFASSLVAILSLQTAMIASFGNQNQQMNNQKLMNTLTGSAVCILIGIMGFVMLIYATNQINQVKSS